MREFASFSNNTIAQFDGKYENIIEFDKLMTNANHGIFEKYNKEETDTIIRNQFNKIMGIDFAAPTNSTMKRRQAWRDHGKEIATLIENIVVDKMNSGWSEANARFMEYVEDINIANGDKNEFYVADNSLLQVSKFAGNHHDIDKYSVRVA